MSKFVYLFDEGNAGMKELLGGKGANLAEMTRAGLPVPEGFTISTEACNQYHVNGRELSADMLAEIASALTDLEQRTQKKFGDPANPLLVSVRSGSVFSMPGMMDTVLNLGLNDQTVEGLAVLTGNARFAYDCYRRFLQMFGDVVLGIDHYYFEQILEDVKHDRGVEHDPDLTADDWKAIIERYKKLVIKETRSEFPQDPQEQLRLSIQAVFASWNNQRAIVYRRINKIPDHLGTAVNVQSMVFGNLGEDSGTGVAFTRNPSTGERVLYGEFLINAQGEDVVAGIRTPQPISALQNVLPEVYGEFEAICERLEQHYQDLQDIEFTVERGKLYILQTRNGKRTAHAAVKVAVDLCSEGVISQQEALMRVDPEALDQLLHRRIDATAKLNVIATGLPASPGAASGVIVFDADLADKWAGDGRQVILVRPETTPDDIHGIVAAQGILTTRGGMTSHAAVVARGMGKPCICGCEDLRIDLEGKKVTVRDVTLREGDLLSIDGGTGRVILGDVPLIDPELSPEFQQLLGWADEVRRLDVRANADNPEDAAKAREFGAQGVGLCRTEHMFMAAERVPIVQEMILAETFEERMEALDKLLPMQQQDFEGILRSMEGLPVTIRLLDPPLHEFLPNLEDLVVELTKLRLQEDVERRTIRAKESLIRKVRALHEFNPMLGHRGCRLGITFPEIYAMQVRAIFQATAQLKAEGVDAIPEVMIPLVGHVNELKEMRHLVLQTAEMVMEETGHKFEFLVGTMIEIPRAALTADEIAQEADFFSFGTNDLTQTTFGFSRDDAEGKFLQHYLQSKLLADNPFQVLDQDGVGQLVKLATEKGRTVKPGLKLGICGEHGGEKHSIDFCYRTGLDYVSCSPFRVPIARLAAAQSTIRHAH
ncbi:pyruvate, phosphate dikinase [Tumebacillus permanentifrigoris]|uniref:Pyruvate, phosphate dikinase n=1 Tax=Tumebacillus permanentifrigoris TaxID=378543 RepID=A0A316D9K5_9BACL|nr:pyruvate, phosphate dikinase [Tumebacillus permanentifrigoris]PWK08418.1 pyruvate phosphate dikinase [Tumebacillus permanentifrigoris]